MNQRQESPFKVGINLIVSVVVAIGFFIALFFVARAVFTILAWLAPVFLVLALIINYRTVVNYGRWLWNLVGRTPLLGIMAILLTVIGFPVVAAFLFGKSFIDRRMRQYMEERGMIDEYIDFEEVPDNEEPLELPRLEDRKERSGE